MSKVSDLEADVASAEKKLRALRSEAQKARERHIRKNLVPLLRNLRLHLSSSGTTLVAAPGSDPSQMKPVKEVVKLMGDRTSFETGSVRVVYSNGCVFVSSPLGGGGALAKMVQKHKLTVADVTSARNEAERLREAAADNIEMAEMAEALADTLA